MVHLTGQHCTPHATAKKGLLKAWALRGSEEGKGSRWHEKGNEEKKERKAVTVKEAKREIKKRRGRRERRGGREVHKACSASFHTHI